MLRTKLSNSCVMVTGGAMAGSVFQIGGEVGRAQPATRPQETPPVTLLHPHDLLGGAVRLRRLPQLDPIPLRIRDPPEATVLGVLDLRIGLDSFVAEGREHAVEVLHPVIDHERRAAPAEVRRLRGEDRPDRVTSDLALSPAPPGEESHRVLDLESQVTTVPFDECLRILRLEEDASDSGHAGATCSCDHAPE